MGAYQSILDDNRLDRFTQVVDGGIILYTEKQLQDLIRQFESCRLPVGGIVARLRSDISSNGQNISVYWTEAKARFDSNPSKYKNALKDRNGANFPDELHIALIMYTLGAGSSSIYTPFNESCRKVCQGKMRLEDMPNLGFFLALRYVMESQEGPHHLEHPELSRGCAGKIDSAMIGKLVAFGQFTSTSEIKATADGFGSTLFVIHNRSNGLPTKMIPMAGHSKFPNEREVLLSPFQLYVLKEIETVGGKQLVHLDLY